MDIFWPNVLEPKPEKKHRTPKEAFHNTEEGVRKLMQPNEKIHLYDDDDLVNYLSQCFDLMAEVDQEMGELVKISDYPNFKEK